MAKMRLFWRLWNWLKVIRRDVIVLYYAWRHPQTPVYLKSIMVALVAYVFSPIDLLPDYLPLFGLADDAALVPAVVLYLMHMLPPAVRAECEAKSYRVTRRLPWILAVLGIVAFAWAAVVIAGLSYIISWLFPR